MVRRVRPVSTVLSVLAPAIVVACSASDPPAATQGFFPARYTGGFVMNAPLVKTAEVSSDKRAFTFHVSVPQDQAFTVVIRCDKGRWVESLPGGEEGGPCSGRALAFIDNGCRGGTRSLKIRVLQAQPANWGTALYTGKGVESADCR
ncbi:MAG TPA: hypothetical protein VFH54_19325 [Mycobacteriales bacterium]|nr:hypothetical protein [Mycobacteriales bacterium]